MMDIAAIAGKSLAECTAGEFVNLLAEAMRQSAAPRVIEHPREVEGWKEVANTLNVTEKVAKRLVADGELGRVVKKRGRTIVANYADLRKAYSKYVAKLPTL